MTSGRRISSESLGNVGALAAEYICLQGMSTGPNMSLGSGQVYCIDSTASKAPFFELLYRPPEKLLSGELRLHLATACTVESGGQEPFLHVIAPAQHKAHEEPPISATIFSSSSNHPI